MSTPVTDTAVEIRNAHKSFGAKKVLDGVDLTIPRGSVTAILGPSGSGKSTLLRAINHLEKLDEGYVRIDGEMIWGETTNDQGRKVTWEGRRAPSLKSPSVPHNGPEAPASGMPIVASPSDPNAQSSAARR